MPGHLRVPSCAAGGVPDQHQQQQLLCQLTAAPSSCCTQGFRVWGLGQHPHLALEVKSLLWEVTVPGTLLRLLPCLHPTAHAPKSYRRRYTAAQSVMRQTHLAVPWDETGMSGFKRTSQTLCMCMCMCAQRKTAPVIRPLCHKVQQVHAGPEPQLPRQQCCQGSQAGTK